MARQAKSTKEQNEFELFFFVTFVSFVVKIPLLERNRPVR